MSMPNRPRESADGAGGEPAGAPAGRPRLLLSADLSFAGSRLARTLRNAGCEVFQAPPDANLVDAVRALDPAPDLLVTRVAPPSRHRLEAIRAVHGATRVPVLGVHSAEVPEDDERVLRRCGVVGLLDVRASRERVLHRVNEIVRPRHSRRRRERTPCFLPVEVTRDGQVSHQYALDLSQRGMRLTLAAPIEPGAEVCLRFGLPMVSSDTIEVRGRVVHRVPGRNSAGLHEVGVAFGALEPRASRLIGQEVARLLAAGEPS